MSSNCDVKDADLLLRLQLSAEPDPGVLIRVLERFQQLNIIPRRVLAVLTSDDGLVIDIRVSDLPHDRLELLAKRVEQFPCVLTTQLSVYGDPACPEPARVC